jgi:AcrR family transcriptional regulator
VAIAEAKQTRHRADRGFKRARIIDAAREVLLRKGTAATMREIAAAAGYTPGALYAYYPGKDDLLADIAAQILGEAGRAVRQTIAGASGPAATIRAAVDALHEHLAVREQDRTLLITVLNGPNALTETGEDESETDRQVTGRIITLLRPVVSALEEAGLTPGQAAVETLALLTQVIGLLVLEGHGRLRRIGFTPQRVLDRQAEHLIKRLGA